METPEKLVLAHWYYSVSEWEHFMRLENKKKQANILFQSLLIGAITFLLIRFALHTHWIKTALISAAITIGFWAMRYYLRTRILIWKAGKIPEIEITDYMAVINDKLVVFQGKGKLLRKVDIKEDNDMNILEISYEWHSGNLASFDELRIPVPKGKLREAMEVQHCLNLRKDLLALFNE
jgi:hypothetical protein